MATLAALIAIGTFLVVVPVVLAYHLRLLVLAIAKRDAAESPIPLVVPLLCVVVAALSNNAAAGRDVPIWCFAVPVAVDFLLLGLRSLIGARRRSGQGT